MPKLNYSKMADGSGRDMYICREQAQNSGRVNLPTMTSQTIFKHLQFRDHTPSRGRAQMSQTARPPSLRRGGPGWQPPIHSKDYRRMAESSKGNFSSTWPAQCEKESEKENRLARAIRVNVRDLQSALDRMPPVTPRRLPNKKQTLSFFADAAGPF
mmetsp:Transcript_22860/g.40883  ORF Transcript_22860/g.40883 Transcript_22860/m.40883 type:complete len:156 (+) Transcript_22860:148-615(+)